jgi:hypothetical protein
MIPVPESQVLSGFQYICISIPIVGWAIISVVLYLNDQSSLDHFLKEISTPQIKKCECGAVYYEIPDDAKYVSPFLWFPCTGTRKDGEPCDSTLTIKVDKYEDEIISKDELLNNCWATREENKRKVS